MFYAFEYNPERPPSLDKNGFEIPAGKLLQFNDRAERRQYIENNKQVGMVNKHYANLLREANHA